MELLANAINFVWHLFFSIRIVLLGPSAMRKLTKMLGDAGVITSIPSATKNRPQKRNFEDELTPLGLTLRPGLDTVDLIG